MTKWVPDWSRTYPSRFLVEVPVQTSYCTVKETKLHYKVKVVTCIDMGNVYEHHLKCYVPQLVPHMEYLNPMLNL